MSVTRSSRFRRPGVFFAATLCVLVPFAATWGDERSDAFDDAGTLESWTVLAPSLHRTLDVGESAKGRLTIQPPANSGWYNDGMGPMLYKEIEGDFLVEADIATHGAETTAAPRAHYNSAGLIVRDPASSRGKQNWVVVNVGRQDPHTGTEVKTTVDSRSHLELQQGTHTGLLRLARIGSTIYALRKLEGEDRWTLIRSVDRQDLPRTVQVGMMCNGWSGQADLVAEFDYVRFSVPGSEADLTAETKE